jgi:hypothetical protein
MGVGVGAPLIGSASLVSGASTYRSKEGVVVATILERAQLRRMAALDVNDPTYTDEVIDTYVSNLGSLEAAAGAIWVEKAASAAVLVDTQESGSSRSMSQVQKNALNMQKHFAPDPDQDDDNKTTSSYTIAIERV